MAKIVHKKINSNKTKFFCFFRKIKANGKQAYKNISTLKDQPGPFTRPIGPKRKGNQHCIMNILVKKTKNPLKISINEYVFPHILNI